MSEVPNPEQRLSPGYSRQQGECAAECPESQTTQNSQRSRELPQLRDRHFDEQLPHNPMQQLSALSGVSRRKGRVPETQYIKFLAVLKPPQLQDRYSEPCPRCPTPSNGSLPDTQGSRGSVPPNVRNLKLG